MEDNKYFLPKLTDFRVGYEYEENFEHSGWESSTYSTFHVNLYNIEKKISEGIIRVPYLTKEQIEGEGWEPVTDSVYTKGNKKFSYQSDMQKVSISEGENIIYNGKCLDINTLRLINSLLNII